jgi:XapX domain-containing protein
LARLAFGSLLVGLLLGLVFSWHQTTSPATALLLGGSILVWAMLSFGSAPPK